MTKMIKMTTLVALTASLLLANLTMLCHALLVPSSCPHNHHHHQNHRGHNYHLSMKRRGRISNNIINIDNDKKSLSALYASDKNREDEIRRKIMELKREGKLQKSPSSSSEDDNNPSSSSTSSSNTTQKNSTPLTPLEKLRQERERQRLSRGGVSGISGKGKSVADDYADKLSSKLGRGSRAKTNRILSSSKSGMSISNVSGGGSSSSSSSKPKAKLGVLDNDYLDDLLDKEDDDDDDDYEYNPQQQNNEPSSDRITNEAASDAIQMIRRNIQDLQADNSGEGEEEDDDDEMEEEDMVDIVAKALGERGEIVGASSRREMVVPDTREGAGEGEREGEGELGVEKKKEGGMSTATPSVTTAATTTAAATTASNVKTTSGVGGSWSPTPKQQAEEYQPSKSGTWGAFPRPRNISVAYGGGKRVGAGVKTDEKRRQESIESTKEKLRAYREKMGIVVQSEIDNKDIIEEALELAGRAMQRGSYSTGVSCLEKVTQYCSTKSKLGGKVFLELAMAYEAEGKTDQALGLYSALSKSPIEQVKMNADRLLYGLEAMNFMRNEAKLKEFSRKKVKETFVDATGFNDITKNFDKVYNTAYIDLDKGSQYYRMLTENVVRSTREARQILLKAVGPGDVERMKIVQALRSISRHFDDALIAEKEQEQSKNVPVDYAGRPIISSRSSSGKDADLAKAIGMDGFILSEAAQTLDNLNGEWKLQLMADRKGEGVNFFNTTECWQTLDVSGMTFKSETPGFRFVSQSGGLGFNEKERILSRSEVSSTGGGLLSFFLGGGKMGTAGEMINVPQQILSVDSALLVTRAVVKVPAADNVKDYFSVWRRVGQGSFASEE